MIPTSDIPRRQMSKIFPHFVPNENPLFVIIFVEDTAFYLLAFAEKCN